MICIQQDKLFSGWGALLQQQLPTSNPEEAFGMLSTLDESESSQQPAGGSVIVSVLTDKAMEAKGDWVTSSKSHSWILSQTAI